MSTPPSTAPPSYHLVGPPDLLHDLVNDFQAIGWEVAVAGWHAVVTAAPEDAAAPSPEWPTEVSLLAVTRAGHAAACAAALGSGG